LHVSLTQEQEKVNAIIYNLHKEISSLKDEAENAYEKSKYGCSLISDLTSASNRYYQQEFSNPAISRNGNKLLKDLDRIIQDSLTKENSIFEKEDYKQIAYDFLAALTWLILTPYAIYKSLETGLFLFFEVKNDTEEKFKNKMASEFEKVLAPSLPQKS
jgi:hypothetical protein